MPERPQANLQTELFKTKQLRGRSAISFRSQLEGLLEESLRSDQAIFEILDLAESVSFACRVRHQTPPHIEQRLAVYDSPS